ncbi:hypothetical protein ABFS82_10G104700 [Erythranthe guttata]|uniref:Uncharacterized protein n=1 Tax=Erythranthe guttata TaxID=4155 RepID=A0A022Q820_ERYGU|nr:PREDICTED: uncharacterized protein At5g01610-like [Erythranthe guttata]EYU22680.1 hypothetical protein MIMGU_mgv1a019238mg [Erythranthe guttata]|eukprot:XP_012855078.1 PREDICTED: uncharacterized protein At5g01610-like [Erythranthe guttata]
MTWNFGNTTTAFFILFVFILSATATNTATAPTAYKAIESYGFPVGILPKGVTNYDLDTSSGKFNAYLNGSCSFSLEGSYELKYKPKISGYIYKDKLTNLSGVSVKVYFVWLNIVEVKRSGENLDFSVGIASADFPIINFYVCPNCSNVDHNYVSSI